MCSTAYVMAVSVRPCTQDEIHSMLPLTGTKICDCLGHRFAFYIWHFAWLCTNIYVILHICVYISHYLTKQMEELNMTKDHWCYVVIMVHKSFSHQLSPWKCQISYPFQ